MRTIGRLGGAGWIIAAVLIGALLSPLARATVVEELSLARMSTDASIVARVTVLRTGHRLEREGDKLVPFTVTELRVDEWLAGDARVATLTVLERGGVRQGEGFWIEGTPIYRVGERLVVFLEHDHRGRLRTVGMAQGKLQWLAGVGGADATVLREPADLAYAHWVDGSLHLGPRMAAPTMPYRDLVTVITKSRTP